MDAVTQVPLPVNEPVRSYAPGTAERDELVETLETLDSADPVDLTGHFGVGRRMGRGELVEVTMPSDHAHVLGRFACSTAGDTREAIDASLAIAPDWAGLSFDDRAAIFLRAADWLAGPWRARLNAATMLGQGKTVQQAEIDAACELIDFWRFNVAFARQIHQVQPISSPSTWNRTDYRPLEGFVYAVTPFNFTAIAANLPTVAALAGNVVLWKPSPTQQFAAHVTMDLLQAAGLPDGVITMVQGPGPEISEVALADPHLAGIHFTGSTPTFHRLWQQVASNLDGYRTYPRLVGETGGKDFVLAHASADPDVLITALVRGAFEYSGQKCSAASRAYVPRTLWGRIKDELMATTEALSVGDVRDLGNFTSAVIDQRAFGKLADVLHAASHDASVTVLAGGTCDDSIGWYVRPTIIECPDAGHNLFRTEFFGPILAVHVYDDDQWQQVITTVDQTASQGLTGAVIATDRAAITQAQQGLRQAAGNFYINDKPTGAVVGQQPFGGGRTSGTNDKAGSMWNLIRWMSPRSIKETLVPLTAIDYPHMARDVADQ